MCVCVCVCKATKRLRTRVGKGVLAPDKNSYVAGKNNAFEKNARKEK